jgi:hypothetical protein
MLINGELVCLCVPTRTHAMFMLISLYVLPDSSQGIILQIVVMPQYNTIIIYNSQKRYVC